jgi:hypothetical protein
MSIVDASPFATYLIEAILLAVIVKCLIVAWNVKLVERDYVDVD